MNLTLVAYKANSESSCRGCVMDRFNSDFSITCGTQEEIVARWGHLLFENTLMEHGEAYHEITLLIDGLSSDYGDYLSHEEVERNLRALAQVAANKLIEAEAERKKRAEAAQKAATARHQREEKLQQFIKLKAEFEPEGELP